VIASYRRIAASTNSGRTTFEGTEIWLPGSPDARGREVHDPGEGTRTRIDEAVVRNQIVVSNARSSGITQSTSYSAQRSREEPLRLASASRS